MEFFAFFTDPNVKEVAATVLLGGVVIFILTGRLVPIGTHKRELASEHERGEQHRLASEKKDVAVQKLLEQNSSLLAGVRIADKFYKDFLPPIDEATIPPQAVRNVGA